jgi:hypothetical protein
MTQRCDDIFAACESSTYGSELVAISIAQDWISGLWLNWRILVFIQGSVNTYGDNNAMVKDTNILESTLSKKLNLINYHIVRKSVATRWQELQWRYRNIY